MSDNTSKKKRVFQVGFLPNGEGKKWIPLRFDAGKF
jgi:hypothetical protein